jgi:IclR family pca regulon transcriptional regulator
MTTSAQGRVFLAHMEGAEAEAAIEGSGDLSRLRAVLQEARERGYAFVDQELEKGMRSVAIAVRGPESGRIVASMSLCAHSNRISADEMIEEGVPALRAAVASAEAAAALRMRVAK